MKKEMEILAFFYHVQLNKSEWRYAEIEVTIESEQIQTIEKDGKISDFIDFVGSCLAQELEIPIESVTPLKREDYNQMQETPTSEWLQHSYMMEF